MPVRAPRTQRLVLIVAVQPAQTLDIVALMDAFGEANRLAPNGPEYEVRIVSGNADRNLTSDGGLTMRAASAYEDCFDIADTLLVAGSDGRVETAHTEQFQIGAHNGHETPGALLAWLRWQASQSRRIGTVSSGVLLLAQAGLLNGRRVTTHWRLHNTLSDRFPRVLLERDVIYVRDANLYTCAGATAGLDFALSMIEEDLGSSIAAEVAQSMLLYFRRTGDSPQISAALRAQAAPANPISDLLVWLPNNLQQDLSIKSLARRAAMSPRNFARIFRRQVGHTPAKHIESLRLKAAQFQLESTDLTVDGAAYVTGFQNGETLRRLFVRRLGVTPGRYRSRNRRFVDRSAPLLGARNFVQELGGR